MKYEEYFSELKTEVYCQLTINGDFIAVVDASKPILTYSSKELIGTNLLFYVPSNEHRLKFKSQIFSGKEGDIFCFPFKTSNKAEIWLEGKFKKINADNGSILMVLHDCTDKILVENRSIETEERYMLLLNNTNEGVIFHEQGLIVDANAAAEHLLGYTVAELKTKLIFDFVEEEAKEILKERISKGEEYVKEGNLIVKDGSKTPFRVTTKNHIYKGRPVRAVFIKDLSEVKAAKEKLFESEEKYKNLVESGQELIFTCDFKGNFTYMNPVGLSRIEYSETEMLSMNYRDLIRNDWLDKVIDFYNKQFKSRQSDSYFEFPVVTKSGSEFWVGQHAHIIMHENRILSFQVYARDITERKIAEDNLRLQKELTDTIFDNLPVSIIIKNKAGRILFANKFVFAFLGITREEIISKSDLEILPKEITDITGKGDEIAWQVGTYFSEEKLELKEATYVVLVGKIILQQDGEEEPLMLSYSIDITQRKQAEDALLEAKKQLEESVLSKERFISIMSHEIRTPMNAVIGITNLLLQQATQEHQEYLQALKVSSVNLLKILNNVLDLTKVESGKIAFEQVDFDIRQSVMDVKELFNLPAAEKNILIVITIDSAIPKILKGDPYRLNQVLVNLVSNAIKFTEEGKIKIEVSVIQINDDSIHLGFKVEDTGIGISPDKFSLIFESFAQADTNITRKYGGTGLGLTITKKLIELMGGRIGVESDKGIGSSFYFDLNFQYSLGVIQAKVKSEISNSNLNGLKVLVVEDNKMNQLIVKKFLEQKKVIVLIAESGREAIDMLKSDIKFDIVLMDLLMPEMDGFETTDYIRNELNIKELPIIALTASSGSDIEQKVFEKDMNGFIVKPFEPSNFYNIIASYAGRNKEELKMSTMQSSEKLTDLSYLREASNDNLEFVKEMIQIFLKQTPIYLSELTSLAQDENWGDFKSVIHKLKPTITMMGIIEGEDLVKSMEASAKSLIGTDAIAPSLSRLQELCELAFEELSQELSK